MDTTILYRRGAALACTLCAFCAAALPVAAQDSGAGSNSAGLNNLKREINAAYAQQQADCKRKPERSRAACLKQASQVHRRDMANAPRLVADAPTGQVRERILGPVEGGASAVGGSSSGATGSSGIQGKDDTAPPRGDASGGLPPPRTEPEVQPHQAIENLPPPRR